MRMRRRAAPHGVPNLCREGKRGAAQAPAGINELLRSDCSVKKSGRVQPLCFPQLETVHGLFSAPQC